MNKRSTCNAGTLDAPGGVDHGCEDLGDYFNGGDEPEDPRSRGLQGMGTDGRDSLPYGTMRTVTNDKRIAEIYTRIGKTV